MFLFIINTIRGKVFGLPLYNLRYDRGDLGTLRQKSTQKINISEIKHLDNTFGHRDDHLKKCATFYFIKKHIFKKKSQCTLWSLWSLLGPWGRDRSQSLLNWIFRVKQVHQSTGSERTTWLCAWYLVGAPWETFRAPGYRFGTLWNSFRQWNGHCL